MLAHHALDLLLGCHADVFDELPQRHVELVVIPKLHYRALYNASF